MLISRECDYAIRILRQLADGKKKNTEDICTREKIPTPFAYKILKKLEKAGFVQAYRGAKGGYSLIMDTDDFSLYDIITAMGDRAELTACMKEGFRCPMNLSGTECAVHQEYARLQGILFAGMREKSMKELLG
jgi:Rrf2 family protein